MSDESNSISPAGASASTAASIHQAVLDLSIARRTLLIYPFSHDQVKRSLKRAYHSLATVLDLQLTIKLTVMQEGLAANGRLLDSKITAFADLAAALKQYQIVALTISKDMGSKELVQLLRLLTAERDKIEARGGMAVVAGENRLDHVTVREADYSKLQMTEESEIMRSSRRVSDGSLWQAFVTDLLSDQGQMSARGKAAAEIEPDPNELAALLNQGNGSPRAAMAHYELAMADAESRTAPAPATAEGLKLFQQMIKELNPELQKQFLASTFDRCAQSSDIASVTRLVEGLGADLLVRMLSQANSDGKRISPSLVAFINKVGHLPSLRDHGGTGDGAVTFQGLAPSKIESLLAHEQYDTYVDAEYCRLLNGLTVQEAAMEQGWGADMAAGFSESCVCVHAARAMARMMTLSADVGGYRDWARQLSYLLNDLLEIGAFDYLIELMHIARTEKAGEDPQRSEIAGRLLSRFSDPQFVAKTIQTVRGSGKDLSPEALAFLKALGEPVVLEIFDSIDPGKTLDEEGNLIQILKSLSSLATREALERIKDSRPDHIVTMLKLIRKIGERQSAQHVRSLLDHGDPEVRTEALATLLKFNNKWGLVRLRELLQRPSELDFRSALDLAGEYGVREVVPQLLSYFKQRRQLELREAALHALGRIGDSRAIPALTQMAHRRWGISKKHIDRLKRVLYQTLEGYPIGEIKHLLHHGLRQKDPEIQAVCRRLLRESTREGGDVPSLNPLPKNLKAEDRFVESGE